MATAESIGQKNYEHDDEPRSLIANARDRQARSAPHPLAFELAMKGECTHGSTAMQCDDSVLWRGVYDYENWPCASFAFIIDRKRPASVELYSIADRMRKLSDYLHNLATDTDRDEASHANDG